MILTFDRAMVERLIAHAKAAPEHGANFGETGPSIPALWLVGDNGVYLMSNGNPGLMVENETKNVVAYARECDPTTMAFDDWWAAKRISFGGDDGAETLPVSDFESALATYPPKQTVVRLDRSATGIAFVTYKVRMKPKKASK